MVSIAEANELGKDMIDQHLNGMGYRLTWDRAQDRAGACNGLYKEITLSTVAIQKYDWTTFEDVMLHEIAHALTWGEDKDHGPKWRRKYLELGGSGNQYCRLFARTDHVEITPVGVIMTVLFIWAAFIALGAFWGWVGISAVVLWAVARWRRSRRPAASEHGLEMVDGEWVTRSE